MYLSYTAESTHFRDVDNTTKTPTGVESRVGGKPQTSDKSSIKTENIKWHNWYHIQIHMSTKQLHTFIVTLSITIHVVLYGTKF